MTKSRLKQEHCWRYKRMVNLETDLKKVEKVVEFLEKHAEFLV